MCSEQRIGLVCVQSIEWCVFRAEDWTAGVCSVSWCVFSELVCVQSRGLDWCVCVQSTGLDGSAEGNIWRLGPTLGAEGSWTISEISI